MDLLILGSVLMCAGLFALGGLLDGSDNSNDEDTSPNPDDPPTQYGTTGDDDLTANEGLLKAWGGDDTITLSGDATGEGGSGDDTITATDHAEGFGGLGDDSLSASGTSTLHGDTGNDLLQAESEANVFGDAGDDTLVGQDQTTLSGGAGADLIYSNDRSHAFGNSGNDTLDASTTNTELDGGTGDDLLIISHGATDNADGVTVEMGSGNDVAFIDPQALVKSTEAGGANPIILTNVSATDRIIIGGATDEDPLFVDGYDLHWMPAEGGGFTLFNKADATNLTVFTSDGAVPNDTLGSSWNVEQQSNLAGYMPDLFSGVANVYGTEGDDHMGGSGIAHGLGGNDTISGSYDGPSYGGDGNDVITANPNSAYGDAGDDTISGIGNMFGGTGNDVLNAGSYKGERDALPDAVGGDGNDTITASDGRDGGGDFDGGAGDDVFSVYTGSDIHGGDGNDMIISTRSELCGHSSIIDLGTGADVLAIDPNNHDGAYDFSSGTEHFVTVTDFDVASGDTLGIIVPQGHIGDLTVSIVQDPAGQFTEVSVTINGTSLSGEPFPAQVYHLQGVTDLNLSDVQLFENSAATLAGTPYAALAT